MTASKGPAGIRKIHSDTDDAHATAAVVVLCASGPERRRASPATGLLRAFCFRAQPGTTREEQRRIVCVKGLLRGAPLKVCQLYLQTIQGAPRHKRQEFRALLTLNRRLHAGRRM